MAFLMSLFFSDKQDGINGSCRNKDYKKGFQIKINFQMIQLKNDLFHFS